MSEAEKNYGRRRGAGQADPFAGRPAELHGLVRTRPNPPGPPQHLQPHREVRHLPNRRTGPLLAELTPSSPFLIPHLFFFFLLIARPLLCPLFRVPPSTPSSTSSRDSINGYPTFPSTLPRKGSAIKLSRFGANAWNLLRLFLSYPLPISTNMFIC